MRLGEIWIDCKRLSVTSGSLVHPPQFSECISKIAVRINIIRSDSYGLGNEINYNVVFPHFMGNKSKHM